MSSGPKRLTAKREVWIRENHHTLIEREMLAEIDALREELKTKKVWDKEDLLNYGLEIERWRALAEQYSGRLVSVIQERDEYRKALRCYAKPSGCAECGQSGDQGVRANRVLAKFDEAEILSG